MKTSKLVLAFAITVLALGFSGVAAAQDGPEIQASILAQELGVADPTLLPDSPFYFLKEWKRKLMGALTFGEVEKTNLQNSIANEKLVELQKLIEINADSKILERSTQGYQKSVEKIKEKADAIKNAAEKDEAVDNFLDKFSAHQILHEEILLRLESQTPESVAEKIRQARERHLERFGEVMQKLEKNKERVAGKIENALKNRGNSAEQILNRIQQKMPGEIRGELNKVGQRIRANINSGDNGLQTVCTMQYDPVCGTDGKTYGNDCVAGAAGVEIASKGKCE